MKRLTHLVIPSPHAVGARDLNCRSTLRGRRALLSALAAALVVALAVPVLAQRSERSKVMSKRLMCMCGCNQLLGECNHVGCSVSTEMLRKLDRLVERGDADDLVLQAFVQEYGTQVLAQPPAKGFNLLAWVVPPLALLAGFAVVRKVLLRWRRAAPAAAGTPDTVSPELLERVRRQADLESEPEPAGPLQRKAG